MERDPAGELTRACLLIVGDGPIDVGGGPLPSHAQRRMHPVMMFGMTGSGAGYNGAFGSRAWKVTGSSPTTKETRP